MGFEISKIGKRGTFVIPAALRQRFKLREGDLVIAQETDKGILLRRAAVVPESEAYTPQRIAEFLLSNAITAEDYAGAVEAVKKLGVDPGQVTHYKPPGV